jgi:hypothetical protein
MTDDENIPTDEDLAPSQERFEKARRKAMMQGSSNPDLEAALMCFLGLDK